MNQRAQVLQKIRSIPALPAASSAVAELLRDPEVEIDDVVRAIEFDQSLTSNVLRLANSAYFAGPRTIGSVRDAVVRLGMNRIFQLVIMTAITPMVREEVHGYDLAPGKLLEHSIAVAVGAEELALELKLHPPLYTFTAGLLHDIGKVVLGTFLEADAESILALAYGENVSFEEAEQDVLGINHAEAGAVLLDTWNLPSGIVDVVRFHHAPDFFGGGVLPVDLVHVASNIASEVGFGRGVDSLRYRMSPNVISRLQYRPSMAESIACKMVAGIDEFRDLMGVETGG